MSNNNIRTSVAVPAGLIADASKKVRDYLRKEKGEDHSPVAIDAALGVWLDRRIDLALEEMPELLTSPRADASAEFAEILREIEVHKSSAGAPARAEETELHPVFRGNREFSLARLAAMMGYLSSKGLELYKTKLNKLLFYADLTAFYLTGQGISGARYVHLPYGPVPDTYEDVITYAEIAGNIQVARVSSTRVEARPIIGGPNAGAAFDMLSDEDRAVLDWVADTYGKYSAGEITDLSHAEMAYKNTRAGESIAYRYAEFLKTLPPDDLLN